MSFLISTLLLQLIFSVKKRYAFILLLCLYWNLGSCFCERNQLHFQSEFSDKYALYSSLWRYIIHSLKISFNFSGHRWQRNSWRIAKEFWCHLISPVGILQILWTYIEQTASSPIIFDRKWANKLDKDCATFQTWERTKKKNLLDEYDWNRLKRNQNRSNLCKTIKWSQFWFSSWAW